MSLLKRYGSHPRGASANTGKTLERGFGRIVALALLCGCGIIVSGCAAPSAMSSSVQYSGPMHLDRDVQAIRVSKAQEGRPGGGESSIALGLIVFIPGVPFGPQKFTPERYFANAAMMGYDFRDDLTQTVVRDLAAAGLARSVGYDAYVGSQREHGVYRLELTLKQGIWNRNFTTYGCSFMGSYWWMLGLPVSYGNVQLAFEATVRAPDGKELGRRLFASEMGLTESAYVPHKFPKRLPLLYQQLSYDFRSFVQECLKNAPPEAERPKPATTAAAQTPPQAMPETASVRLENLKALKDKGILTEEEYEVRRKRLVEEL